MRDNSTSSLKNIFIAGLLVVIPLAVTAIILVFLFNLFDSWLAPLGNQALQWAGVTRLPLGMQRVPGLGIVATLLLILVAGLLASNFFGRKLLKWGDTFIRNIPVVSSVYRGVSQVISSFSLEGRTPFKTVVLLKFPNSGFWTLGFLTTPSPPLINRLAGKPMVNVFVPVAPIPSQGFLLMVPEKDLKVLPISPEEALKMIATLGLAQNEPPALAAGAISKKTVRKNKKGK